MPGKKTPTNHKCGVSLALHIDGLTPPALKVWCDKPPGHHGGHYSRHWTVHWAEAPSAREIIEAAESG